VSAGRIGLLIAGLVVICAAVPLIVFRRPIHEIIRDSTQILRGSWSRFMTGSPKAILWTGVAWIGFGLIAVALALALPNYHAVS